MVTCDIRDDTCNVWDTYDDDVWDTCDVCDIYDIWDTCDEQIVTQKCVRRQIGGIFGC